MTETKKDRPKGRPPTPVAEKKVRNFTFRSRGDMHERLSRSASGNERSISEEIERRLEASFEFEAKLEQLRNVWTERVEEIRKQSREHQEETTAAIAELRQANLELERAHAQVLPAAEVIDVLLGKNEASTDLIKKVAFELMSNPDWDGNKAQRRQIADRIHAFIYPPQIFGEQ